MGNKIRKLKDEVLDKFEGDEKKTTRKGGEKQTEGTASGGVDDVPEGTTGDTGVQVEKETSKVEDNNLRAIPAQENTHGQQVTNILTG